MTRHLRKKGRKECYLYRWGIESISLAGEGNLIPSGGRASKRVVPPGEESSRGKRLTSRGGDWSAIITIRGDSILDRREESSREGGEGRKTLLLGEEGGDSRTCANGRGIGKRFLFRGGEMFFFRGPTRRGGFFPRREENRHTLLGEGSTHSRIREGIFLYLVGGGKRELVLFSCGDGGTKKGKSGRGGSLRGRGKKKEKGRALTDGDSSGERKESFFDKGGEGEKAFPPLS